MYLRCYLKRFIIMLTFSTSLHSLVFIFVVLSPTQRLWSPVRGHDTEQLLHSSYQKSDEEQEPRNPAMVTCIGYGKLKTSDFNVTSCEKRFPNTIIIGVTKCGTNALLRFTKCIELLQSPRSSTFPFPFPCASHLR